MYVGFTVSCMHVAIAMRVKKSYIYNRNMTGKVSISEFVIIRILHCIGSYIYVPLASYLMYRAL